MTFMGKEMNILDTHSKITIFIPIDGLFGHLVRPFGPNGKIKFLEVHIVSLKFFARNNMDGLSGGFFLWFQLFDCFTMKWQCISICIASTDRRLKINFLYAWLITLNIRLFSCTVTCFRCYAVCCEKIATTITTTDVLREILFLKQKWIWNLIRCLK